MAAKQSPYLAPPRTDNGPFLQIDLHDANGNIVPRNDPAAQTALVWFSDVKLKNPPPNKWLLLVAVDSESLTLFPRIWDHTNAAYGEHKYDPLQSFEIIDPTQHPYTLPHDEGSLENILSTLPPGFAKDWRYGLGVIKPYQYITNAISDLEGVDTLVFQDSTDSEPVALSGNRYYLGFGEFDELCTRLDRVSARHQRDAAKDKKLLCYIGLLHNLAPEKYPPRSRALPPDMLKDLVSLGRNKLSKGDRSSAAKLVRNNVPAIAREEPNTLYALKAEIEEVTLAEMISAYKKLLGQKHAEERWQAFFTTHTFILDMAFGYPVKLVATKAYVGGKDISGKGGQYTDFVMAARSTGNAAIIEIKHPGMNLLAKKTYRDGVYGPSKDLGGAISQALNQRASLQAEIRNLTDRLDDDARIRSYAVPVVIVAGLTPDSKIEQRSFEHLRHSMKDVQIITFDELQGRLETILRALRPDDNDIETDQA